MIAAKRLNFATSSLAVYLAAGGLLLAGAVGTSALALAQVPAIQPQPAEEVKQVAFYASANYCARYMGGPMYTGDSETGQYATELVEAIAKTNRTSIREAQLTVWANCAAREQDRK